MFFFPNFIFFQTELQTDLHKLELCDGTATQKAMLPGTSLDLIIKHEVKELEKERKKPGIHPAYCGGNNRTEWKRHKGFL